MARREDWPEGGQYFPSPEEKDVTAYCEQATMYGSAAYLRPPSVSGKSEPSLQRGSRESASRGKFTAKSFKYNGRVAAVLLTSLLVLVGYGGPAVAGVLIVRFYCIIIIVGGCDNRGFLLADWFNACLCHGCYAIQRGVLFGGMDVVGAVKFGHGI